MSQQDNQDQDWSELPDLILEKIMLLMGLSSLESLDSCRQVCRAWNVAIMRKLRENPSKSWGSIIRKRIENSWSIKGNYPSEKEISSAKLLGNVNDTQKSIK